MDAITRRALLLEQLSSNNIVELRELVENIAKKFEVQKYRKDKFELITLGNIVHKVMEDRASTVKTIRDLQNTLGVKLECFVNLRLAYGWASFINPSNGTIIEELEGDAQLTRDWLMIIEQQMGYNPCESKYASITQEALDKRNREARDRINASLEQEESYNSSLDRYKV